MRRFKRHQRGRIYVMDRAHIPEVKKIMKSIDEFEYEYAPDELIVDIELFPKTIHVGKFDEFDLDMLTIECFRCGMPIFVYMEDE